ncbi:thiamine ABC transporter ATP-binding protein ThiQ [Edwardsiella piscicida]|uniref:thiamine ABC transporter ATP-binding protein ThiQ n=1 Tax=Edwardsiella piscicida TaxID=1263550 RepID=UPI000D51EE23|nr:thiamine ABC transporter ATP-binding protein ThiQ [Edwardsiella piscicida]QBB11839.1 thiamine ABC transporter ATP-binding protein ThiQ [Edwardsiella piscicida]UCQ15253.1 thiamine ABC transporter ATP-binding protein ThiQ [Edwardsiella piscicida]UCQ38438.1 thiamine ABC transporter ATP-binding protein ThiQ [Edwardsiella piscicida]UCQ41772.1 thiamine ABC transporter ATP-binding protein ThiQ [Edwardsiella piscicida]
MIRLDNLLYRYQQQTLSFSLHAAAGKRIAILGPSGAGKSTLLSLIAGFLAPSSGDLYLNSIDCRCAPPSQRPVSMLFQEHNLFAHLTIAQNLGLGLDPGLRLDDDQRRRLADIAELVGIHDYLPRLPGQLSGGQRQRAALARCLLRRQPILLLDEPFSALDPALRAEMLTLLDDVCRQRQLTLLMVSHNLDDAARIAPRTLVIDDGHIAYDGPTAALLTGSVAAARLLGRKVPEQAE